MLYFYYRPLLTDAQLEPKLPNVPTISAQNELLLFSDNLGHPL